MASVIDICNLALARLGDRATVASIDPPEGSAQADHCARFYPLARDIALEAKRWGFNTVRSVDDALYVDPQPGWAYAYAKPNDCLRIITLAPPGVTEWWLAEPVEFTTETDLVSGAELILCNVPNATIVYQKRITDTDRFPPQFVSALAWLLASYLAGSVVKGDAGRKAGLAAYQAYQQELAQAATINANQSQRKRRYISDAMRARSGVPDSVVLDAPIIGQYGWYAYPGAVGPLNG